MRLTKMLSMVAALALLAGSAFSATRDIYPDPAQAKTDLAAALKTAAATHKRVIVDFGGNWCGDCQEAHQAGLQRGHGDLLNACSDWIKIPQQWPCARALLRFADRG
jgi:thiol:disulfide interchange protein